VAEKGRASSTEVKMKGAIIGWPTIERERTSLRRSGVL